MRIVLNFSFSAAKDSAVSACFLAIKASSSAFFADCIATSFSSIAACNWFWNVLFNEAFSIFSLIICCSFSSRSLSRLLDAVWNILRISFKAASNPFVSIPFSCMITSSMLFSTIANMRFSVSAFFSSVPSAILAISAFPRLITSSGQLTAKFAICISPFLYVPCVYKHIIAHIPCQCNHS